LGLLMMINVMKSLFMKPYHILGGEKNV